MKAKNFIGLIVLVLVMLLMTVQPVMAKPDISGDPPVAAQVVQLAEIGDTLSELFGPIVPQLLTLAGLIILQVVLAVALAIREKVFDWKKLADFYRVMVLPMVIGWLAFAFVIKLISIDLLGPQYSVIVGDGVTWLAWLAVVASLGARIVETVKALYGAFIPFKEPESNGLGRG